MENTRALVSAAEGEVVVRVYDDSALAFHVEAAETHLISLPVAALLTALAAGDLTREAVEHILCTGAPEVSSADALAAGEAAPETREIDETIAQLAALGLVRDWSVAPR